MRSTIHRVLYNSPAGAPRYSVPLFLHPNRGTVISGRGGERVDTYRWGGGIWKWDGCWECGLAGRL